jgi:hypothetical protein
MRSVLQSHERWWRRLTRALAVAALASCAGFGLGAVAHADLSEAECVEAGGDGLTLLVKVPGGGKDTSSVVPALARQMRTLPTALRRSLTWDRGLELAQHAAFTVATDVQVYFCDPQSPWQRGTNENTNGFLPKGTDLTVHSQADLNRIAHRLNTRPRKTLGYRTPAAMFARSVAMTHGVQSWLQGRC